MFVKLIDVIAQAPPDRVPVTKPIREWRLDQTSPDRHEKVTGPEPEIVVFGEAGYASSLAVASLRRLGHSRVTDLVGWVRGMEGGRPAVGLEPGQAFGDERWQARRGGLVRALC